MSDTPRTDGAIRTYEGWCRHDNWEYVYPEFAQDLERQLNELERISLRMVEIFDESGDEICAKQFRKAIKETLNYE